MNVLGYLIIGIGLLLGGVMVFMFTRMWQCSFLGNSSVWKSSEVKPVEGGTTPQYAILTNKQGNDTFYFYMSVFFEGANLMYQISFYQNDQLLAYLPAQQMTQFVSSQYNNFTKSLVLSQGPKLQISAIPATASTTITQSIFGATQQAAIDSYFLANKAKIKSEYVQLDGSMLKYVVRIADKQQKCGYSDIVLVQLAYQAPGTGATTGSLSFSTNP